jgi:hypothetical protein
VWKQIFGMFGLNDVDRGLEERMSHFTITLNLAHQHHQSYGEGHKNRFKGNNFFNAGTQQKQWQQALTIYHIIITPILEF